MTTTGNSGGQQTGFVPFNRTGGTGTGVTGGNGFSGNGTANNGRTTTTSSGVKNKIPTLRLLSNTPVGGYGASTTGAVNGKLASSTTAFRWVDRGRGNIYEALGNTLDIMTISNTVVPKIVESAWNKNLTGFVALTISDDNDQVNSVYAELRARAVPKTVAARTSTSTRLSTSTNAVSATNSNPSSLTPYELRGKSLPRNIVAYAVSPRKDRVFMFVNDNGTGIGYIANFDGSVPVQIFTTPVTQ
ncbi:MAG: hypothetical protein RL536_427, partial [Candidatus Parcubacteria bacterium]